MRLILSTPSALLIRFRERSSTRRWRTMMGLRRRALREDAENESSPSVTSASPSKLAGWAIVRSWRALRPKSRLREMEPREASVFKALGNSALAMRPAMIGVMKWSRRRRANKVSSTGFKQPRLGFGLELWGSAFWVRLSMASQREVASSMMAAARSARRCRSAVLLWDWASMSRRPT